MNAVHPNIEVLQKFDPANIAAAVDIIADNAIFHYFNPRLPDIQGDYVGFEGFLAFFKKIGELTNGTFKVNPISATPVGNELVVVQSKNTMVLNDQPIAIDVVVVWRIVDDKIIEVWDIPSVYDQSTKP